MVTTISFERMRKNVRMLLERSPEYEQLMPLEKTRIRLEMFRIMERTYWIKTREHDSKLPGNTVQNVVNTLFPTTLQHELRRFSAQDLSEESEEEIQSDTTREG